MHHEWEVVLPICSSSTGIEYAIGSSKSGADGAEAMISSNEARASILMGP